MSDEIVVEGEDYYFSTDAWSVYTGRQILSGAMLFAGLMLAVWGSYTMSALVTIRLVAQIGDGVLIQSTTHGASFGVTFAIACLGAVLFGFGIAFWPFPWQYGESIEEAGYQ